MIGIRGFMHRAGLWLAARAAPARPAAVNFRAWVTHLALQTIMARGGDGQFHAMEIGCMFREEEGRSTLEIARFLADSSPRGRFYSIDSDPDNIEACKRLIKDRDAGLLHRVNFVCGMSNESLPLVLDELQTVDFALLDGGSHPEHCLVEFELVLERLSSRGIVVVDDIQEIPPTPFYPAGKPFGKGTLILPYLVLADYLKYRPSLRRKARSSLVDKTERSGLIASLQELEYVLIARSGHKILLVGRRPSIESLYQRLKTEMIADVSLSPWIPREKGTG